MKEQIDEMAMDIYSIFRSETISRAMASMLVEKGWRKRSEGKTTKGCEYCKGRAYTKKPLTVITKYGRRIELVFEFCPNCGRKMKGSDNEQRAD
jgi:hypothetical protein